MNNKNKKTRLTKNKIALLKYIQKENEQSKIMNKNEHQNKT